MIDLRRGSNAMAHPALAMKSGMQRGGGEDVPQLGLRRSRLRRPL